jgi:hypothetical protein
VEGRLRVLREALEEELEERVYVLARDGRRVDGRAVVRVRVANIDWLVEEDDVRVCVPRVRVVRRVLALSCDAARAQLEQQASLPGKLEHGSIVTEERRTHNARATWATVEPKDKRSILRLGAGLEEPGEVGKIRCLRGKGDATNQ